MSKRTIDDASEIFDFCAHTLAKGQGCALAVVTNISGGSLRQCGAMMAVTEGGVVAGYISNGCVDADIVLQAQRALQDNSVLSLIYGAGSPFKDITLPCGGAIEIRIIANPDYKIMRQASQNLQARLEIIVRFSSTTAISIDKGLAREADGCEDDFTCLYKPKIRLRIAGRGSVVMALARQAGQIGFDVYLQSPELEDSQGLKLVGFDHLTRPQSPPSICDDPYTAFALMFHDHDWEGALLKQALAGEAFYIGAMGSQHTHALRCDLLRDMGVSSAQINRISAPIGLIPFARNANLLALSTLAEITKQAQMTGRI